MKLIVEMEEMPRACPCELATEIEGNFYTCFAYYGVIERAVEFDKCMRDGKRPDWCPIKGVLPDEHGDLIDRDALMETIRTHDYPLRDYFNSTDRGMYSVGIQQAVDEQPTVDAVPISYIYEKASELKNDDMMYAYKVLIGLIANYRADGKRKEQDDATN